jgi:hypothetical protein
VPSVLVANVLCPHRTQCAYVEQYYRHLKGVTKHSRARTVITSICIDLVRPRACHRLELELAAASLLATAKGSSCTSVVRGIEMLTRGSPAENASTTIGAKKPAACSAESVSSSVTTISAAATPLPASRLMRRSSWRACSSPARFSLDTMNARSSPWCAAGRTHHTGRRVCLSANLYSR